MDSGLQQLQQLQQGLQGMMQPTQPELVKMCSTVTVLAGSGEYIAWIAIKVRSFENKRSGCDFSYSRESSVQSSMHSSSGAGYGNPTVLVPVPESRISSVPGTTPWRARVVGTKASLVPGSRYRTHHTRSVHRLDGARVPVPSPTGFRFQVP